MSEFVDESSSIGPGCGASGDSESKVEAARVRTESNIGGRNYQSLRYQPSNPSRVRLWIQEVMATTARRVIPRYIFHVLIEYDTIHAGNKSHKYNQNSRASRALTRPKRKNCVEFQFYPHYKGVDIHPIIYIYIIYTPSYIPFLYDTFLYSTVPPSPPSKTSTPLASPMASTPSL